MKQVLISAVTAGVICVLAFVVAARLGDDGLAAQPEPDAAASVPAAVEAAVAPSPVTLSYTVEPTEDSWVNGARSTGADDRLLSDAGHSVCFLTKVEVSGFQGPEDRGICRVSIDEFTGFWKITADVPEGSRSEIRCNARCLEWQGDE